MECDTNHFSGVFDATSQEAANHSTINKTTPLRILGCPDTEAFCTCNLLVDFTTFLFLMGGPLACFFKFLDANMPWETKICLA
jgi:hypothetical protein